MPGKPYKSCLIPYENEINALRRQRPPMPYAQIAALLQDKYNLRIQYPAIFKFIKRSCSRKGDRFSRTAPAKKPAPNQPASLLADPGSDSPPKPKFEFTYSERYNLKRLPKEEAAAIRKKLEEEGH